ncbi:MAG TPA: hypothetical protein VHT92_12495 [Candidatus Cybelea sp.]|jgi:hypothetical protein|nr:hypothetical protein [Candidatus Cybelea sp.]
MARADPTRSRYSATRHLLRNLGKPKALRKNPLACDAFDRSGDADALDAIARRVDSAFRAMDARARHRDGARHAALLLRVDVQRHDPRDVITDLGYSPRQFHRARRAAHERFFEAYSGTTGGRVLEVDGAFGARLLTRAASLADSGETASAVAIFDDIARSGADPALRGEALIRLAESDAWAHRLDRTRIRLNDAAALTATAELSDQRRAQLDGMREAVALSLHWFEKGPSAVSHPNGSAATRHASSDRAMLVRAAAVLRSGEAALASKLLASLDATASLLQTPEAAVDLLLLRGELEDFTPDHPLLSEELFTHAAGLARSHGLRGRELYAMHQLALTRWAHTRAPQDRRAYRALVDRMDRTLPPRLRSYLTFSAADVELAIGHPRRALAAAQAAAKLSTNRYESFSARGLAAGALLRLGLLGEAGAQAAIAADAARSEGHARVLSLAQRINAQAYLAQGNRRAARIAIDESIECARYFASAHALAQAQAVLGRIAGKG